MSPITLTTTGGAIPSWTMNVRIRCSCTESNGDPVDPVRWYDPAGTRLVSAQNAAQFNPNAPHFERVDGANSDILLIIPTFSDSYDGVYTCGRVAASRGALTPPIAIVTLTIDSELMINAIIYLYQQQEALAAQFDFTSFSSRPFFSSWPLLFLHQGCSG